jgi:peptidoglycan L-alanyl-D-glutamate endopeptidase CwlK
MDKSTKDRIAKLHPKVREEMKTIIDECNVALSGRSKIRISQGLRTFAEQDALFKQKPKVTNAKGGQSIHNYGFAVDIVLIIDGKTASWDIHKDWDNDKVSDWDECVSIFAKHGWSWGGSWASFKDFPHFEKIGFNNWRTLLFKDKDSEGYVIV